MGLGMRLEASKSFTEAFTSSSSTRERISLQQRTRDLCDFMLVWAQHKNTLQDKVWCYWCDKGGGRAEQTTALRHL